MKSMSVASSPASTESWPEYLLDLLSCWLMSIGGILAFDQLFRFHASFFAMLWHPLLFLGILLLFRRRLWILAAILGGGCVITLVVLVSTDTWLAALDYVFGFLDWWISLFPKSSSFNTDGNIQLVLWLIHLGITLTLYFLVRVIRSPVVIGAAAALLLIVIRLNGFIQLFWPLFWILLGLIPLAARSFHPRFRPFAATVPVNRRSTAQAAAALIGAAACLISCSLGLLDTSQWTWRPLNNIMTDLSSVMRMKGHNTYTPLTLKELGLQPNLDQLGGNIRLDSSTRVMRVKTDTPTLMKGSVYTTYTGRGWTRDVPTAYRWDSSLFEEEKQEAFSLNLPDASLYPLWMGITEISTAEVTLLRPSSMLFAFGKVNDVHLSTAYHAPAMFNLQGELFVQGTPPSNSLYRIHSLFLDRQAAGFRDQFTAIEYGAPEDPAYPAIRNTYTELPDFITPLTRRIAELATRDAITPYEKAAALESYLKRNYTYTLTPGDVPDNRDFVDYFLTTGEGYCVYFASAMTVMARLLDIPTRLAVGYGLDHMENGEWIAMRKNAHAWVECYFSGIGWVTFDPTAGSSYTAPSSYGGSQITGGSDSDRLEESDPTDPDESTVPSSDPGQLPSDPMTEPELTTSAPTSTPETDAPALTDPSAPLPPIGRTEPLIPPWVWPLIGLIALLVLGIVLLIRRIVTFRSDYSLELVRQRMPQPEQQADWYLRDIRRQLAHLGLTRHAGETLLQFGRRIQAADWAGPDLTPLLSGLMDWQYGEVPPSPIQVEQLAAIHQELEPLVRIRLKAWRYFWIRRVAHR